MSFRKIAPGKSEPKGVKGHGQQKNHGAGQKGGRPEGQKPRRRPVGGKR